MNKSQNSISSNNKLLKQAIMNQLISNLRETNSFGYKVIRQQDVKIIQNWYQNIHKVNNIQLKLQLLKFFGTISTLYAYLIIGLTNQGDSIVSSIQIPKFIQVCINGLNRKLIKLESQALQSKSNSSINSIKILTKQSKMFILSNPDSITGQSLSYNSLVQIINICKQNNMYLIIDQSLGDLCPNFTTTLPQTYQKLIVIKQLGSILQNNSIAKHVCIFNNLQIKQKCTNQSAAKSLKILPSQLTLQLIITTMNGHGLEYQQRVIKNIQQNYRFIIKRLNKLGIKLDIKQKCNSQFLLLNLIDVPKQHKEIIDKYFNQKSIQLLDNNQSTVSNSKFIKINLNVEKQQLVNKIQQIENSLIILKSKL